VATGAGTAAGDQARTARAWRGALQPDARAPRRGPRRRFPDRAEEWSSYLYFLREHAAVDGSVPASFNRLIGEAFAGLVL
jgi:hypothetical protein